jgi:hypothetical protein
MQIFPTNGWFMGFRRCIKNPVLLTLVGLVLLAIVAAKVDDRVRQHEVAVTIRELLSLRPGKTPASEAMAIAQKRGLTPYGFSQRDIVPLCSGENCLLYKVVQADPLIDWVTERGTEFTGIKATWFEALGFRPWAVRFTIEVRRDLLDDFSIEFGTTKPMPHHPYEGWWWNSVSVSCAADISTLFLQYDWEHNRAALQNPNYAAWTRKNVFTVATTGVNSDGLDTAFSVDLGCLSKHACHALGDVIPKAWRRFCSGQSQESNLYQECFSAVKGKAEE